MDTATATRRKVPRNYIPVGAITRTEAALRCEKPENINEVLEDMTVMKSDIIHRGRVWVQRIMLDVAQKRKVTSTYKKDGGCMLFPELRDRWREWKPEKEPELRKDFFHIAVGHFDLHEGWAEELEEQYMEEHGIAYEVEPCENMSAEERKTRKPAGFVQRLINTSKVDVVKLLFKLGREQTHGWYINSTNREGPRGFRRKPGKYSDVFVHNDMGRTKDGKCNRKHKTHHQTHLITITFVPVPQSSKMQNQMTHMMPR